MHRPKTLSASFVKAVNRPGRYGDGGGGHGLSLLVKPHVNGAIIEELGAAPAYERASVRPWVGIVSHDNIGCSS